MACIPNQNSELIEDRCLRVASVFPWAAQAAHEIKALKAEIKRLQTEDDNDQLRARLDDLEEATRIAVIDPLKAEVERLQGIVDRQQHEIELRTSKRKDCLVCGQDVPFPGAVYCSEKCALEPTTGG